MGLLFRPRRPLLRLASGAATAGIAYHAGSRQAAQDAYDEQAASAYQATQLSPTPAEQETGQTGQGPASPWPRSAQGPGPAATGAPLVPDLVPDDPTVAELARLAQLHQAGSLTDAEFAAAKARVIQG
jgi:hypothetical protein